MNDETPMKPEELTPDPEEILPDNVTEFPSGKKEHENPWRLVGAKFGQRQMQVQTDDGIEIKPGFILKLQFLDREPGKLITKHGDKTRDVNVPIPMGMPNVKLYELFATIPWMIQQHLDGVPPNQITANPPEEFLVQFMPAMADPTKGEG